MNFMNVHGMLVCISFPISACMFIVSKAKVGRSLLQKNQQKKKKKKKHTHTQKPTINRNNTHNIYNILCTYQENPIEAVQLIYWIYVDKNRI